MTFISYAQNFEDVILNRALKHIDKGTYIDVGANDPIIYSITKSFYDLGWQGINLEPVSEWFEKIEQHRPEDINLQIAAGAEEGKVKFFELPGTGLSTMDESIAKSQAQKHNIELKSYEVSTSTLTSICAKYQHPDIHFLKIDVEGAESIVLEGLDLKKVRPWIILIESTLPSSQIESHQKWEHLLTENDYHFVYFDAINRYYVADEHDELDDAFKMPPNIFDNFKLAQENDINYEIQLGKTKKLEEELQHVQTINDEMKLELEEPQHLQTINDEMKLELTDFKNKVKQYQVSLQSKHENIKKLTYKAESAEQKVEELHDLSQHWWKTASAIDNELQRVYRSRTWRYTKIIRARAKLQKLILERLEYLFAATVLSLKSLAKRSLVRVMKFSAKHPALNQWSMRFLNRYPQLMARLRRIAKSHSLIVRGSVLANSKIGSSKDEFSRLARYKSVLTPRAFQILEEMHSVASEMKKEII